LLCTNKTYLIKKADEIMHGKLPLNLTIEYDTLA